MTENSSWKQLLLTRLLREPPHNTKETMWRQWCCMQLYTHKKYIDFSRQTQAVERVPWPRKSERGRTPTWTAHHSHPSLALCLPPPERWKQAECHQGPALVSWYTNDWHCGWQSKSPLLTISSVSEVKLGSYKLNNIHESINNTCSVQNA